MRFRANAGYSTALAGMLLGCSAAPATPPAAPAAPPVAAPVPAAPSAQAGAAAPTPSVSVPPNAPAPAAQPAPAAPVAADAVAEGPTGGDGLARGTGEPADKELALGDAAYDAEKYKEARAHFRKAEQLAPKDPAPKLGL